MNLSYFVRRCALAAALVGLLAVSGCADAGSEPEAKPKLPSPSASQTPSKTPKPKPMTEEESAEAFAREWAEELIRMQNTGDAKAFNAMNLECEHCDLTVARIEKIYEAGGSVSTDQWPIHKVTVQTHPHDGIVGAVLDVTSTPAEVVDRSGAAPRTVQGEDTRILLKLVKKRGKWLVWGIGEYT